MDQNAAHNQSNHQREVLEQAARRQLANICSTKPRRYQPGIPTPGGKVYTNWCPLCSRQYQYSSEKHLQKVLFMHMKRCKGDQG